jgi:glyoxylase-like metal-dependent hydrolase (beta-lactamase superfamily II)
MCGALAIVAAAHMLPVRAQQNPGATRTAGAARDVATFQVRGGIYMLVGAGANITVQIGDEGVLLVDTGLEATSEQVLAAVRTLTDEPIRWIINTHAHPDHTGGNAAIARAGRSLPQISTGVGKLFSDAEQVATIVAHENVQKRISAQRPPAPVDGWPTATFFTRKKEMFFNGEPIQIIHEPAAHGDGDVVVFFRRSDVIVAGDVYVDTGYPMIDTAAGGTIGGLVDAINDVIDIAIPAEKQEGGTYVVPGHGRLADEADVVDVRDMLTIVRDRVQSMMGRGMTLEQIKAAKPTLDYDGRYSLPQWTGDMFVEAVYRTLGGSAPRTAAITRER